MTTTTSTPRSRAPRAASPAPGTSRSACHVNPDGDALGSMLGLFHVLRAAGRDVVASFPQPFVVAPHYRELPGLDLLTAPGRLPARARRDGHLRLRVARVASATSSPPPRPPVS